MALTKLQADAVIKLFVSSFSNESNEKNRKKIFIDFEDAFGKGIADWQSICKEEMEHYTSNKGVMEHFDMLIHRKEGQSVCCDYLIRELAESDLKAVIELINCAFSMRLTSYDNERFKKFMESGYSFVACNNNDILGVVLGYFAPNLSMDEVIWTPLRWQKQQEGMGLVRNCSRTSRTVHH